MLEWVGTRLVRNRWTRWSESLDTRNMSADSVSKFVARVKTKARTPQLLLLAMVVMCSCTRTITTPPATVVLPSDANALDSLYRNHDYFALRERLSNPETNLASTDFYIAAVQQAFNDPVRSNG